MRIHKCFLLLLVLLVAPNSFNATAADQRLRIVTEDLPPYNYLTNQGNLSGASIEIVQALLETLKLETKIEILPWARAYKEALTEPNVLIFSLLRTNERENSFHWLSPITPINIKVFAMPASAIVPFSDLNYIGNKTLGVVRHSSQVDFVNRHKKITRKNLVIGRSFEQLYKMNLLGRVDLFMAPELLVQYLNYSGGIKPGQQPQPVYVLPERLQRKLYLAFSKTTPLSKVTRFRQTLDQMHKNGQINKILYDFRLQLAQVNTNALTVK